MIEIIVTDLTRFKKESIVCIAGIDAKSGTCIRPMPYFDRNEYKRLKILPGTILSGDFMPASNKEGPHQEDMGYKNLSYRGASTSDAFKAALKTGLYSSAEDGFDISLSDNQKYIPFGHDLNRSLITIKVNPTTIKIVEDSYKPGKLKIHFMDQSNRWFRYLPITDLGFHNYAINKYKANNLDSLNTFINSQPEAYLRIGLSRVWEINSIKAYWMQVNGVYTFPSFLEELRDYK